MYTIVFSSPPQRPMTSDFEGFSIPDFIHYIYFPILILEKEPVFPFLCSVLNQGTTGTIFITSLVWSGPWQGIEPGPLALEASTIPQGYRGGGFETLVFISIWICVLADSGKLAKQSRHKLLWLDGMLFIAKTCWFHGVNWWRGHVCLLLLM